MPRATGIRKSPRTSNASAADGPCIAWPGRAAPSSTRACGCRTERSIITKGNESGADGYSAFEGRSAAGTTLADELKRRGVEHLIVGGLATDYCVRASVLDACNAGLAVTVLADAIRGVEAAPGDSDRAIEEMKAAGARLAGAADIQT